MNKQLNINIEIQEIQQKMLSYLQKHWKLFAAEGVFFIILGSIAVIIPQVFSQGITLFLGGLFLIGGIIKLWNNESLLKTLLNKSGYIP